MTTSEHLWDVAIVGAGPAGTTCALALAGSGLRVILLDKSIFPRDKVCGDAIPARALHVLRAIDPLHAKALQAFPKKTNIKSCRIVAPSQEHFDFVFHTGGYCSPRMDFDQFLLERAAQVPEIELRTGSGLSSISKATSCWQLRLKDGTALSAKVVVGCDGAQSQVARQLTGFRKDPEHHCAAVRAYFKDVAHSPANALEIHFLEEYLPGYFWIFPLPNGLSNVGFGMLSAQVSQRKVNLRQSLLDITQHAPGLSERFAGALQIGETTGFGLPMGSRQVTMSGEGFLLCGDAAALIEPATGEGIGNAMLSGQFAARHLKTAFETGDFSAEAFRAYDQEVYQKLWKDLRRKYLAQRYLGERKKLMNWLVRRANRQGPIKWLMKKVF